MRVDFNVPLTYDEKTSSRRISNPQRILAAIPTVQLALQAGADAVILCSHLGRPGGKVDSKLSLDIVASYLQEQLKVEVNFISDCVGEEAKRACENATGGAVILLENLRFHPEEEGKPLKMGDGTKKAQDPADIAKFREALMGLGTVYVNDA